MITVIMGEDRYRVLDQKRKLAKAEAEEVEGLTEEVKSSAQCASLFGIMKYILRCRSIEDFTYTELMPFVDTPSTELYIFPEDTKTGKCMTQLEKAGAKLLRLDKLSEKQLEAFVVKYAARADRQIEVAAYALLVKRCAYFESDESDLGTVVNELDKLIAVCSENIYEADVKEYTQIIPVANVFNLSDLVLRKKRRQALTLADKLMQKRDFDALRTISLLEQCYRVGYKASMLEGSIKAKAQVLGVRVVRDIPKDVALQGLNEIAVAKEAIKSGNSAEAIFIRLICQLTEKK